MKDRIIRGERKSFFLGKHCEIELDPCKNNPCSHGKCLVLTPFVRTCVCEVGWKGIDCQESINECVSNPCLNAGKCIDQMNKYYCQCLTGFTGENCQTEINICASTPCQNNGKCIIIKRIILFFLLIYRNMYQQY